WVASLSPWPEEFGLDRMRELLDRLGHPERRYPAIHVVGTNGKSTATRTIAALLHAEGRRAGAYTSPHVGGWAERIWVNGAEADFERAVARVRPDASAIGATQFEALTAAALLEFAERRVEVAVVEAGLGGRLDATNVVDAEIVLLTNVSLEHTEVLGDTTEQIAKEKLAVAHAARIVVLPDNQYADLVPKSAEIVTGDARMAAEIFLGRKSEAQPRVALPGRLEHRGRELWDGAHTPAGTAWLRERIGEPVEVVVASILADKDTDAMLEDLAALAPRPRLVATASDNPRALPAEQLATRAAPHFAHVEIEPDPHRALMHARQSSTGLILVTGSLYLLANLARAEEQGVR
ncbi:MAG TPA: Mur ligase family protein, partial [Gaiellaceae bacterium]|nr:Mur ligase family protein [Gaiellaceae bacterium]